MADRDLTEDLRNATLDFVDVMFDAFKFSADEVTEAVKAHHKRQGKEKGINFQQVVDITGLNLSSDMADKIVEEFGNLLKSNRSKQSQTAPSAPQEPGGTEPTHVTYTSTLDTVYNYLSSMGELGGLKGFTKEQVLREYRRALASRFAEYTRNVT